MKLKVLPEDFVVKELARLPLREKGPYRVYILEKKGWNTIDLLLRLAKARGLPYRLFSYGGLKDRHAHTFQYVTVRHPLDLTTEEAKFSLRSIGWMDRPMGPDLLKGNEFALTLRALSEEEVSRIMRRVDEVRGFGYPNYYDDQRFGSMDRQMGLMAERLLKKHYNGSLQIYLTGIYPEEKKEAKERKLFFREHWGDWATCLSRAKTTMERKIFGLLTEKPKAYVEALRLIPAEELSLLFSAYQSFLFNELLRRILEDLGLELTAVPGVAGPYLFYRRLDRKQLVYLDSLSLPLAASRMEFPDAMSERHFTAILEERGLRRGSFNLRKVRQAYFKSTPRKAIIFPADLHVHPAESDELYPGKQKIRLSFKLPRGSYGTMLVKRLIMP
ncbi:tRNA pseudouridine(13) synthase TruD [Thermanaeromonas sp. C210]|uniref:tRNA pseudouridine(13) synthase TruD n=1 Tax=Thermanaeromonas sp. C210 TaxID=2731925 RepID=UPI00155B4BA9|nr:tRNA pseudouridine(13) synthase TruD [Thermanaeromonas sp. C210]GFN21997.1 tRNA pseudouridine synthase D [Thermanaeromonas sp. C210]